MQINNRNKTFFLLFLLLIVSVHIYSQDINASLNSVDSLSIADKESLVQDINGELCSIIIINTPLDSLKFYSNLGVEKIIKINNGYKIWIPSQSSIIKLFIPGCPLFEYNLPHSNFKYSVYMISLNVEYSDEIILMDTIKPRLSFSISPSKAKIYVNGSYIGKSPVIINNPMFDRFDYLIKKKGFSSFFSSDSIDKSLKSITVTLNDLSRTRRYFLIINYKWDGSTRSLVDTYGMPGVTFGIFGKTGLYGTFNYISVNNPSAVFVPNSYYNTYNEGKKYSFSAGISQQIIKPIFIYGGACYTNRTYHRTGYLDGKSESLNINTGIIFRIAWYCLLQVDYCPSINNTYGSFGIGVGFNIGKKNRIQ